MLRRSEVIMKPILVYLFFVREQFKRVLTAHDAMVFENRFIEPCRDVLRCMASDISLRDAVVDTHVKLLMRIAQEANECLESWRFERDLLGITD